MSSLPSVFSTESREVVYVYKIEKDWMIKSSLVNKNQTAHCKPTASDDRKTFRSVPKPVPMRDHQENIMSEDMKTADIMQSLMTSSRSNVDSGCLARQMLIQRTRDPCPSASRSEFMPTHQIAPASASWADTSPNSMMLGAPLGGSLQPQPTSRSGHPHPSMAVGNQYNHHVYGTAPCTTDCTLDAMIRESFRPHDY